jgi:hypothetical protein
VVSFISSEPLIIVKEVKIMTPVEIMALVVIVLGVIKLIVLAINPKSWMGVIDSVFSKPMLTTVVSLVLGALVLWFLLKEITIVHVFGTMLFFMFLMLLGISMYGKELMPFVKKIMKQKGLLKRGWLLLVIWIALMLWVILALFF